MKPDSLPPEVLMSDETTAERLEEHVLQLAEVVAQVCETGLGR